MQAGEAREVVKTVCPVCGKPLVLQDVSTNYCYWHDDERRCVKIAECEHYGWVVVGNLCFDCPECSENCRGVEKLKELTLDRAFDGTAVWLLVPREAGGGGRRAVKLRIFLTEPADPSEFPAIGSIDDVVVSKIVRAEIIYLGVDKRRAIAYYAVDDDPMVAKLVVIDEMRDTNWCSARISRISSTWSWC